MPNIRTFIAIELPVEVRIALFQRGQVLAKHLESTGIVRWVPKENLHLTLRFLGDTSSEILPAVAGGMNEIGLRFRKFDLSLGVLGCFPNAKKPRVIWAGLEGDISSLTNLKSDIDTMLSAMGWPLEKRRFHAHITLGRVKKSQRMKDSNFPWDVTLDPLPIEVSEFSLIRSDLTPSGAIYTVQHRSPLEALDAR